MESARVHTTKQQRVYYIHIARLMMMCACVCIVLLSYTINNACGIKKKFVCDPEKRRWNQFQLEKTGMSYKQNNAIITGSSRGIKCCAAILQLFP